MNALTLYAKTKKFFSFSGAGVISLLSMVFLLFTMQPFSAKSQPFCAQDPIPSSQLDLRLNPDYDPTKCPAGDIRIISASLKLDNVCNSCKPGDVLTAALLIKINHNTNSSNRYLGVFADLTETKTDGSVSICKVVRSTGPVLVSSSDQVLDFGKITFTCGSKLVMDKILLAWTAANGGVPITTANNPNGKYCYSNPVITITPPFNGVLKASCGSGNTTNIDLIVTGGSGNFSYLWSNGATTEDLTNVTLGTYTVTVTDNIKLDALGIPCTITESITFNGPCCEFTATCPAISDLGTFDCKTFGNIPAHPGSESAAEATPYNMVIGNNPCGIIRVSSADNAIPNKCSTSDQTITRTVVVYDDLNKDNIKDANEPSKTCTYTYVIKADVTAPVAPTAPLAVSYQCAKDVPAAETLTAQDNCSGTVTGVPSDGAPTSDPCNYSFVRTWTFNDACGNPSSVKQTISVKDDIAPSLTGTLPTGATNQNLCYNVIPAGPTSTAIAALYTEKCSKVTVTKTGAPTGDNCNWTVTYHYVIEDDCGNKAVPVDIIYSGGDKTPPKITCPADKIITCGSSTAGTTLGTGIAIATDNCGGTVKITYTDVTSSCGNDSYVITRTWKATDPCQNSSECVQKITVNTKLIAGCFTAQLTKRVFDGKNTTFTFNACANGCPNALSNIAFVIANGIKVVSPLNGGDYQGNFSQYKVSVPVSKSVNGIKYEVIGEGIKNAACDVFTFSLAGDQTSLPITVEFKAGTNTTSVIVKPEVCLCQQTQSIVSKFLPAIAIHDNLTVAAYPNPFMDEVTFAINSPTSGKAILELHDVVGRKLAVVYNGYLFEGKSQVIIYNVPSTFKGALIYTLRVGKEQVNGKLIRMK